jgi:hypothetical protein
MYDFAVERNERTTRIAPLSAPCEYHLRFHLGHLGIMHQTSFAIPNGRANMALDDLRANGFVQRGNTVELTGNERMWW